MVLLNSLNDRVNKLRHKVDDVKLNAKKCHLFFMEILYKIRFVAKFKKSSNSLKFGLNVFFSS